MPAALPVIALALHAVEGVAWVNALAQVATIASIQAGVSAAVRNNSKVKQQGGMISLNIDSAAPRRLVVGKRMTGGVLVDWYLAGSNNTKLYLPVYLSEGPCGQITKVYAGGRLVWSTPLVHGVRTTIPDFRSGGDRLWLTYHDGRVGQTADTTLTGLSQGWTSANKMTGCAYVLIECQWDSDNLRTPPALTFEMEGAKLYDRRKDTTAGGSGSHRLDDPATWEWSDNPAVALDHFMLGRYWDGARTFGIGLTSDEVPYDRFAAQANVCDEDVDTKAGGTQKRYRANGFIFASDEYADSITKLCTAMAARPADFGGRFGVIGIESRTPVLTIDDADVIATASEVYTPKRSWASLVGAIEGRYQDPAQLYQPVDYPRVTDDAWEDEDGGEPKLATLDLEFEIDVERAQRLATLKARAERRQATLKGVYPLWTVELERGDWFIRTGAQWGEDGKTFEVLERILNPETFTVSIVAQEVDPADSAWDESTAQDGPPEPLDSTDTLSDVEVPAIVVSAITLAGTAASIPALKVTWTTPTDPRVRHFYVEAENVDGVTPKVTRTVLLPADVNELVIQDGIVDGDSYAVSAKFLTDANPSDWCVAEIEAASGTYAVGAASSVPWSGVTGSGKPADNATVGAQAGTNLYRSDGTTVLTQAEVRTAEGVAASITSQGALATQNNAAWGSQVSGRPTELTDGRVAAGLDSSGYVLAGISSLIGRTEMIGALAGSNLAVNPEFSNSTTGWTAYNNAGGSKLTIALETDNTAPNGTRKRLKISYDGTGTENSNPVPGFGGAYQTIDYAGDGNPSRPGYYAKGTKLLFLVYANIPVGRQIEETSNATGTAGTFTWLTDRAGTGAWKLYAGIRTIDTTGTFSISGYIYVSGGANSAFDWYIARFDQIDLSGARRQYLGASLYDTNGVARFNADLITLIGTAAAITSQGALATMNNVGAANLIAGVGKNAFVDPYHRRISDASIYTSANGTGLALTDYNVTALDKRQRLFILGAGTPTTGATFGFYQNTANRALPVVPGTKVEASAYVGGYGLCIIDVQVFWINSSGSIFASSNTGRHGTYGTVAAMTKSGGGGDLANYERIGGVVTAPSGAVGAVFGCHGYIPTVTTVANAYFYMMQPMIAYAGANQTEMSPWNPGHDGEPGSDVTSSNTSAAITGQGNMATGNSYYQSSDPGGNNGDFWGDTTNGVLKYKTGGSWVIIGDIGGALKATIGSAINVIGSSGFSGDIAVTVTGGDGSYTYLWTKEPYEAGISTVLTNTATNNVHLAASLSTGQDSTGRVRCTIKDGKGRSITISQSYNFSKTS